MPPTLEETIKPTPELLYLLCGDPVELSAVLAGMQPPDIAEALRELEPEAAAKVLAALPFDLAVQIFDEPELVQHRAAIVAKMSDRDAADLVDVARLISKYNLLAMPVVDEEQHILGIVTVDDVIDALVKEETEDVQKFGGMEALDEPYTEISFLKMVKKRAGWLCALFLGEMLTATAMGRFQHEIERAVVLALFIPLIISSGGNSGSQATSLIIRALALGEVQLRDWWRVIRRELAAGFALGCMLGAIGLIRILAWQSFIRPGLYG